jgi:hypothetical protein
MNALSPQPTEYLGQEGEDPTSPFWASGNYVGPYWSDGKVQQSVEWGDKPALHELDALARQHDAAYAHYKDERHREAADAIFAAEAKKLKQKYGPKLADDPQFAAAMVEYGNHTIRQIKKLVGSGIFVPGLGPLAIAKYGYDHVKEFTSRIKGTYLKNEELDVRRFQETDPRKTRMSSGQGTETDKPSGKKSAASGVSLGSTPSPGISRNGNTPVSTKLKALELSSPRDPNVNIDPRSRVRSKSLPKLPKAQLLRKMKGKTARTNGKRRVRGQNPKTKKKKSAKTNKNNIVRSL